MSKEDIRRIAKNEIMILVDNNHPVIRADELKRRIKSHVDLSDVPDDEKDDALINQELYPLLAQLNWASVIKRRGYFINMQICKDPFYWRRVLENSQYDKDAIDRIIQKKNLLSPFTSDYMPGQMVLNPETGEILEEKTTEELLEMLARDAV